MYNEVIPSLFFCFRCLTKKRFLLYRRTQESIDLPLPLLPSPLVMKAPYKCLEKGGEGSPIALYDVALLYIYNLLSLSSPSLAPLTWLGAITETEKMGLISEAKVPKKEKRRLIHVFLRVQSIRDKYSAQK